MRRGPDVLIEMVAEQPDGTLLVMEAWHNTITRRPGETYMETIDRAIVETLDRYGFDYARSWQTFDGNHANAGTNFREGPNE